MSSELQMFIFSSPTYPRNQLELELKQERERRLKNSRSIPGKSSQKPEPKMVIIVSPFLTYLIFRDDLDGLESSLSWNTC